MASITIDNLQPMVEYEELSGAELESVVGGFAWIPFLTVVGAAAGVGGLGVSVGSLAWSMAMAR